MKNYIAISNGCAGFGLTRELAEVDSRGNAQRQGTLPLTEEQEDRRKQLYPWIPKEGMLHIQGVGCLCVKGNLAWDASSKLDTIVCFKHSIFYILATLYGDKLTYEDICCAIRPEIDELFKDSGAISIKDMPPIKLADKRNDFKPHTFYNFNDEVVVGICDKEVGLKRIYEPMYHVVDLQDDEGVLDSVSYLGMKMGVLFNRDSCIDLRSTF